MILVTGGLGFIGAHTARALLDLGASCVLTQHGVGRKPDFLAEEIGSRVFARPALAEKLKPPHPRRANCLGLRPVSGK